MIRSQAFAAGFLLCFTVAAPVVVCAQETDRQSVDTTDDENFPLLDRYYGLEQRLRSKGIRIELGSILPGSSLAGGVEYRRDRILGIPIGASIAGTFSVRGYREYDLRVGRLRGYEYRTELRPVDADLTSVFSDHARLAFGRSLYLHVRERLYPRMDFFGLGQTSDVVRRSDYGLSGSSVDAVGQWQMNRHFGMSGRVGILDLRLRPGTNSDLPDVQRQFSSASAPGLDLQHRYGVIGAAATLDYRDAPHMTTQGTFFGVAVWRGSPRDMRDDALTWTRVTSEVRHFFQARSPRHVIALHGLVSTRVDGLRAPTPYYLQPTLGGSNTLRGFGSYRLIGDAAWATSVEYRWQVHRRVQIAPFLDAGAVADRWSHLGGVPAAITPGIGLRATAGGRVIGRLDFARSRDGNRLVFTLGAPF